MKMRLLVALLLLAAFVACRSAGQSTSTETDLATFLENADSTILRLSNEANQAGWTQATYITPDTEAMSARASEAYMNAVTNFARQAAAFNADSATPV
jgi:peptidyl-dipeptidase A